MYSHFFKAVNHSQIGKKSMPISKTNLQQDYKTQEQHVYYNTLLIIFTKVTDSYVRFGIMMTAAVMYFSCFVCYNISDHTLHLISATKINAKLRPKLITWYKTIPYSWLKVTRGEQLAASYIFIPDCKLHVKINTLTHTIVQGHQKLIWWGKTWWDGQCGQFACQQRSWSVHLFWVT